jgi:hypothetical protein
MKTVDFFYISRQLITPLLLSFLVCYALPAVAEQPNPEDFNQPSPLVLTLSDEWLEQGNEDTDLGHSNQASSNSTLNQNSLNEKANIGCNMDMIPDVNSDTSLSSRMVGKCNFNYHY